MFKKLLKLLFLSVLMMTFQACSLNQDTIKSVAQTKSASEIVYYKNEILKSLKTYKKKLDLRNPYAFNESLSKDIFYQIDTNQNYINIVQNGKSLKTAREYLHFAFSSEKVKNRNDLLILGIYKLIYKAYNLKEEHHFAAIQYNKEDMLDLYKYLQVVRWKIRTSKDFNNEYLFKTWQNNWQIELMNTKSKDLNIINELKYIKNKKETIYDHSNFSFEVVISKMLTNIEHSLKKINVEPYEMSIQAIKSFVFVI